MILRSAWNNSDGHAHGLQCSKFHCHIVKRGKEVPRQPDFCSSAQISTPPKTAVRGFHRGGRNSPLPIDFWVRSSPEAVKLIQCIYICTMLDTSLWTLGPYGTKYSCLTLVVIRTSVKTLIDALILIINEYIQQKFLFCVIYYVMNKDMEIILCLIHL